MWGRVALGDPDIRAGLAGGSLVSDARLRDAFRVLREAEAEPAPAADSAEVGVDAVGSAVFLEAEVVRLQRWLDDVHRRVAVVERQP